MNFKKVSQLPALASLNPNDQFLASYAGNSYKLSYDTLSADLKRKIGPTPDKNFMDCVFKCRTEESQLSDLNTLTEKTFNLDQDRFIYETTDLYSTDHTTKMGSINEYVLRPSKFNDIEIHFGSYLSETNVAAGTVQSSLTIYSGNHYLLVSRWAENYNGNTGAVPERSSFCFISTRAASSEAPGIRSTNLYIGGKADGKMPGNIYTRPYIIIPPNNWVMPKKYLEDESREQTYASLSYRADNKITDINNHVITKFTSPSSGHPVTTLAFVISEDMFNTMNIMF